MRTVSDKALVWSYGCKHAVTETKFYGTWEAGRLHKAILYIASVMTLL